MVVEKAVSFFRGVSFPRMLAESVVVTSEENTTHVECVDHIGLHDEHFGVHIEYEDLFNAIIFLALIYISGQWASRVFSMPALVGQIVAGILLGPPLADFVPDPAGWVLIGEIGYVPCTTGSMRTQVRMPLLPRHRMILL